ncbi:MAG: VCBS repeat-containing protein [Catalinimonas sp.]
MLTPHSSVRALLSAAWRRVRRPLWAVVVLLPAGNTPPDDRWTYLEIDNQKPMWGDYAGPNWLRYFGLDAGDLNGDGFPDVVSGRSVYFSPAGDLSGAWRKVDLGLNADGMLIMDVDGDAYGDLIAQALPDVYWFEATDRAGTAWRARKIGQIPATSHVNSQGFTRAQVVPGGREEFLIAGNGDIYLFEIPGRPERDDWKITRVAVNTSDEGIGTGDIDGDGDLDLAAGRRPDGEGEPRVVVWFENPGTGGGDWPDHPLGETNHPADRFGVADLNGDGRPDVVVCEERYPGQEPDGNIFWYEQGATDTAAWTRHWVVTQYSSNNLSLCDIDGDGDVDLLTSEHKGPDPKLQLWRNDGTGGFTETVLDRGKESHLGTLTVDMDGDGDLDIISAGWDHHQYVHLWRNDG